MEDEIFKARYEKEQMFKRRDADRKKREQRDKAPKWTPGNRQSTSGNGRFTAVSIRTLIFYNLYS